MNRERDFLQEVSLLAFFRGDPHFIQILAYSHNDLAICMVYYSQGSLGNWIESVRDGSEPSGPEHTSAQLLSFSRDIAAGLEKMHRAGFVHSDMKPENILIAKKTLTDGNVKYSAVISDLGSTQIVGTQSLTVRAFHVVRKYEATIAYAPPEVVRRFYDQNGKPLKSCSDWPMSVHEAQSADVYGYGMVG